MRKSQAVFIAWLLSVRAIMPCLTQSIYGNMRNLLIYHLKKRNYLSSLGYAQSLVASGGVSSSGAARALSLS